MPFHLELSDTEILMDPEGVLFHVNMELTKRRIELQERMKKAKFCANDLKGHVVCVGDGKIRVACETNGTERSVPISRPRIRQLLADINRK